METLVEQRADRLDTLAKIFFNFSSSEAAGCLNQLIDDNVEAERRSILFSLGQVDVAELYSPERVTARAEDFGLQAGIAMDLQEVNPFTGKPWDFSTDKDRNTARWYVTSVKPKILIGSPPCTLFSSMQHLSKQARDPEKYDRLWKEACGHIAFSFELYEMQLEGGRNFLHEQP